MMRVIDAERGCSQGGGLFCRQEGPHQKKAYARAPGQAFRHLESAGRDVIKNSGEIIK